MLYGFIMNLKKIFERKGFRELVVKSVVFVGLPALMEVLCAPHALAGGAARELKLFSFLQACLCG